MREGKAPSAFGEVLTAALELVVELIKQETTSAVSNC